MKSKNVKQGNVLKKQSIQIFGFISWRASKISMDISTGWLKSDIYTWIYPWIYPWISISTASLAI